MKVFKSAGFQNEYLVTLLIDQSTPNNLSRKVHDRNHAKYRCKQATVLSIVHKDSNQSVESIQSNYDQNFIYCVGEILTVPDYNDDIDEVCIDGIHFYLTEETARSHEHPPHNGTHQTWYPDGQIQEQSNFLNGRLHGSY